MIPKRDSKPFKIKFAVGIEKTNKTDMQYEDEWHTCYGLIRDTANSLAVNVYGYEPIYDKVITLNAGAITRRINYDTLFIVDNIPTGVYKKGDYSVKQISNEYNGEIVIGLSKKEAVNIPKMYFKHDGKVLYYQLNFDKDTLKAYVSNKDIIPFKEGDYVWTKEPIDSDPTKNRLKFFNKKEFGFDDKYKKYYELTFVKE